jgi:hypothetical protein
VPPPFALAEKEAEICFDEPLQEPDAQKDDRRDAHQEYEQRQHARLWIEHEVRAEHGGDRAAGAEEGTRAAAEVPANSVISACVSVATNPPVKYKPSQRACPKASSTFLPKIARNNMSPRMSLQLPCMNIALL